MPFNMFNSAAKIVLVLITATMCVGMFYGVVDSKDFMVLATMVFSFYYSKNGHND